MKKLDIKYQITGWRSWTLTLRHVAIVQPKIVFG